MIYTKMTIRAMQIAYEAHHGQVDKAGVPYILHPVHLAEDMEDEISTCVALLHDVIEDTAWTAEQLAREFPPEVIEALRLLTHEEGEPYMDYVRRIRGNAVARRVKLADLTHNSDESRLTGAAVDPEQRERLRKRYARAREYLQGE